MERSLYMASNGMNFYANEYSLLVEPDDTAPQLCPQFVHFITLRCACACEGVHRLPASLACMPASMLGGQLVRALCV
jgi:hypothetical protein